MTNNAVFVQYTSLDDLTLESMLDSPLMSQQVISESYNLHGTRQKQFIACRYLLAKLLNQHMDIATLPTIIIGDNSRPQFKQHNLPDFNISHSGDYIAVAIATMGKIGLDIEYQRDRKNYLSIAKQFFSTSENEWLNQQNNPLDAFWQLWTLRESALKLYAKGVWQMKEMQIDMPSRHICAPFGQSFYANYQLLDPIHLSVCCSNPVELITFNQ